MEHIDPVASEPNNLLGSAAGMTGHLPVKIERISLGEEKCGFIGVGTNPGINRFSGGNNIWVCRSLFRIIDCSL